ncbi:MAG: Glucan endo-1,3-beta-glucosidase [Chlamydiae bacterium]|nr:Glucan endo-1,3-beta-glucosidase [Chlamydiota bacterium]
MKRLIALIASLHLLLLSAEATTFSNDRVVKFHDKYVNETKQLAADAGLTSPPCVSGLLPVILVNNSGLSDDKVFILVLGNVVGTATQFFLSLDSGSCPGKGTAHLVQPGDNGSSFTFTLSQLPDADTFLPPGNPGKILYLPAIAGGRIYISMDSTLTIPIVSGRIQEPNFTSPADPNYLINFDKYELAYDNTKPGNPVVFMNSTAVDYFSIPLQGIVFNQANGPVKSAASGLSGSRSTIMTNVAATFTAAPEGTEWNKLFLTNGSDILRVVNPTKSIAQGTAGGQTPFDLNYFDNFGTYGYSYIDDMWDGMSSFYRSGAKELHMKIPAGTGSGQTYKADFSTAVVLFTSITDASKKVKFLAPTTMSPNTTTTLIFAGLRLFDATDPVNSANLADAQQISQIFEEAIIASILPKDIPSTLPLTTGDTVNPNSPNNISSEAAHANFYKINPNLTGTGPTTGPWFSLYSKAVHDEGLIYTYAFDEGMWPQVLIGAQAQKSTYVQVTIGNVSE